MNRSIVFSAALHASLLGTFLIIGARGNLSLDGLRQAIHEATAPEVSTATSVQNVAESQVTVDKAAATVTAAQPVVEAPKAPVAPAKSKTLTLPAKKSSALPSKAKAHSSSQTAEAISPNLDAEAQRQEVVETEDSADQLKTSAEVKAPSETDTQPKTEVQEEAVSNAEDKGSEMTVAVQATESNKEDKAADQADLREEMIRPLSELRALPGNPVPQYEENDRLAGRSGTVVFWAEVREDGSLTNFEMQESSGHRELDAKTLKALKKWKFAAGQAGFVEIPFQWDLTGGVQELPALRGKSLPRSAR